MTSNQLSSTDVSGWSISAISQLLRFTVSDGCWLFHGMRNRAGYGVVPVWSNGKTTNFLAHRAMFAVGYETTVPSGLCVCHHCDNPGCVRPDHLFLGTKRDNTIDRDIKGRTRNGNKEKLTCVRGHGLSGENLYQSRGRRYCRTCMRDRVRRVALDRISQGIVCRYCLARPRVVGMACDRCRLQRREWQRKRRAAAGDEQP